MTSNNATEMYCPLCEQVSAPLMTVNKIAFLICTACGLRFKHHTHFPTDADEKAHYDHHENDAEDVGYRRFLSKLISPLMVQLPQGAQVLDFGSGPVVNGETPALAMMMREHGYDVSFYDPFYHNDSTCLLHDYDAVTLTEVIEHFHHPRRMFDQLAQLLRPGGWLAVMTTVYDDTHDFATWYYHRDPTHVSFYCEDTFTWIARHYGYELKRPHRNVALFQKAFSFDRISART